MGMAILKSEKKLCTCCMEEHEVKTVLVDEQATFKNATVKYKATYLYCELADEFYMNEEQMQENDIRLKDAYRESEGLLTSEEIIAIREKYGISQSDLCKLLGWGGKTITRYESHQVQDKAHDTILKKLNNDPEWFLFLLNQAKNLLSQDSYNKYYRIVADLLEKEQDCYLRKAIEANYAKYSENALYNGNKKLSLDKVVDVICYFAASKKVTNLYKVKLMKLLWYADNLSYKKRGFAITGLVYEALPMGAVPIGHRNIINLKDVPCEEVDMGESNGYSFYLDSANGFSHLDEDEKRILDIVIDNLGAMSTKDIIDFMHKEQAYLNTPLRVVISFEYAKYLQIE